MKEFTSWVDFEAYVRAYNEKHGNKYNNVKKHLAADVIFSNDTKDWVRHDYTADERTYKIGNSDKWWYPECAGRSIFASCPAEYGLIRLDEYLYDWDIEKIVITKEEA